MKLISLASLLLTTAALGVAPSALADTAPTDVSEVAAQQGHPVAARVSVAGEVGRYVVGPLGHVRAFILKDGTAVMFRDNEGDAVAKEVAVGQSIRVEGRSPAASGGKMIFRPTVYGLHGVVASPPAGGRGGDPAARQEKRAEMRAEIAKLPVVSASGTVQTVLSGRRGEAVGVVLTDGTSVFLRPRMIKEMGARTIHVGDRIESTGKGAVYPLGTSVLAKSVTFADGTRFEARGKAPAAAGPVSETL